MQGKKPFGRVAIMRSVNGGVKAVAIMVIVNCSGQPENGEELRFGDRPEHSAVASATPRDAGANTGADTSTDTADEGATPIVDAIVDIVMETADIPMPANPSHVSFLVPRVAEEVILRMTTGGDYPFPLPHKITPSGDFLIITLFMTEGTEMGVTIVPVDKSHNPVAEPARLSVRPQAKLGTTDVHFGGSTLVVEFANGAEQVLHLGENVFDKPATRQVINGEEFLVRQGVFTAPEAGTYHIRWTSPGALFSFLDTPPVERQDFFEVTLEEGQKLALWPKVDEDEAVKGTVTRKEPASFPPASEE